MSDADPAQFDGAGSPDNASTVQRLAAALAIARGGMSFIFAVCNSVPLRNRILAELVPRVPGALTVELTRPSDDAFNAALAAAGEVRPPVIFVIGLDLPLLDPDPESTALTAFNASRELWWSRFSCPVVFFLSEAALLRVMRGAPDLWSRKSHVFEFTDEIGGLTAMPAMSLSNIATDIATWPDARRAARLVELQARLAQTEADVSAHERAVRARWLDECGHLHLAMGHMSEAATAFDSAASHAEAAKDWRAFASYQAWTAFVYSELGDLSKAYSQIRTSIDRCAAEDAPNERAMAELLNALATIQRRQGDLAGARRSMERGIAIMQKSFDSDHPNFATAYANLALIQEEQGDLPEARASIERAIVIDGKHFAPNHPTFATHYANLALIQQLQGDLRGARTNIERAIAIQEEHFASDHPTSAAHYSNLAMNQRAQGDLSGARASMQRAIAIDQKHLSPDNPTLAISWTNLGGICYAEGDRAAACTNFKKALAILLKHFDENHPHVKSVRTSMKIAGCPD
jgi:tetratricopeptide (TPR) repeat protein